MTYLDKEHNITSDFTFRHTILPIYSRFGDNLIICLKQNIDIDKLPQERE